MSKGIFGKFLCLCIFIFLLTFSVFPKENIPAPVSVLGFTPGDDYKLASWSRIVDYFQKLAKESDRVMYKEIGKTTEGKPFVYTVISSKKNLSKLNYYININNQLADPRLIKRSENKAKQLIKKGKTFVLITHGIHSTEVGSTLSSMLTAYKLASSNDADIKKILDETIIVIVPSLNPDGVDIVKEWYDKTLGTEFEGTSPPELYQKYVGHDNNRDWYAFTQKETKLTVEKIHNVFHPQIVHDIHQQGQNGARFFVPPYLTPVEPNVPQEIIEGYTEIGNSVAKQMREDGLKGITTGSTYDAWTPARAYSHYHGGVRILSETASAKLASPIEVDVNDLGSRRGFDVTKVSANYAPLWKGGKWGMRDITNYMTTGAFHLMTHAAENRKAWLQRFYKIGMNATRTPTKGETYAYIFDEANSKNIGRTMNILGQAGVEITTVGEFTLDGKKYADYTPVILANQPYISFARAMIEEQIYPDLIDKKGNPIPPYDVTAHNIALLNGTKFVRAMKPFEINDPPPIVGDGGGSGSGMGCGRTPETRWLYQSYIPSMDEGWTRWVLSNYGYQIPNRNPCESYFKSTNNKEILSDNLNDAKFIVFPDQSPNSILNGYKDGSMPKEYTGGLEGKGVENLKKFVNNGGTLVFLNRSSDFAIEQFNLPVKNIAKDWERKDFFIPGSILRTELDTSHPIVKGLEKESIAWFERSPVFESLDNTRVKVIAKYPTKADDILLSGWALGKEKIAEKAALVEVSMGNGKIILFGFRPQYRGQSLATFPLLFNSIAKQTEKRTARLPVG